MTVPELAAVTGLHERYLRDNGPRGGRPRTISPYDPATHQFTLPEEQAMVFAVDDSPVNMTGAFDLMVALMAAQDKVQEAFKTGGGVSWDDNIGCVCFAVAKFFRPGYRR